MTSGLFALATDLTVKVRYNKGELIGLWWLKAFLKASANIFLES